MSISDTFWKNHHGLQDPIHEALGMYPHRPPRPEFEGIQLDTAEETRGGAMALQPLVKQRLKDIANDGRRVNAARGVANADVMQSARGGTAFDRAMVRGKALSRVALQGQMQVQQQTMRDRIGMTRFGQGLRSGTARDLGDMSVLQGEATAGNMRRQQLMNANYANAAGTLAGAAWGAYSNYFGGDGGSGLGKTTDGRKSYSEMI